MDIGEAKQQVIAEAQRLWPLVESCQTSDALVAAFPKFLQDGEHPSLIGKQKLLYYLRHHRDSFAVGIPGHVCGVCLAFRMTMSDTGLDGGLRICATCRADLDALTVPNNEEDYEDMTMFSIDWLVALAVSLGRIPSREESFDWSNPYIFGRWTDEHSSVSCSPRYKRHDGRVVFGFVWDVPRSTIHLGAVFEEVDFGAAPVAFTDFQSSGHDTLLEVQRLMLALDLPRSSWAD